MNSTDNITFERKWHSKGRLFKIVHQAFNYSKPSDRLSKLSES